MTSGDSPPISKCGRAPFRVSKTLLGRSVLGAPGGDMALERAQLVGLVAAGILLHQLGEERLGLEGGVARELGDHPGPVSVKGIGPRPMRAWLFELAGQFRQPLVFARGADAHAGSVGRLLLGFAFVTFVSHP